MAWDTDKCVNGYPVPFTNFDAINLVTNVANFKNPVFVQTHANGLTRSAYTHVPFGGMTLCVVGHIHLNPANGAFAGAGNSYIPGWLDWQMPTPAAHCVVISNLANQGAFPGAARYPF